ncbi:sulfite exporter TauE/SafE family protein [Lutispora saccharofermentans]|uniref:Probable membrane transporter protein n=1 Tax=Lutispora saccharofermentans TaxID=3024236 RepID=A0ABT1NDW7_9FIRM|nr:sulfite exporter TauE/SafE family protein [Lutispora saccharofermentans]MCQ1529442.1 sulfite exporter TauE/SafE family protein [Lutispora saccharofermentans]
MVKIILGALGLLTLTFLVFFVKDYFENKNNLSKTNWAGLLGVGFITNFLDTLGIGSFAPTTALFKFFNMVPDRVIPGTLNVGDTVPVVFEAFLFIAAITVEPITLVTMLAASAIGAVVGAGFVSKLPEKKIQIGMGFALLVVAFFMLAGLMDWMPIGGEAIGLTGGKLIFGIIANFILGALMTIGVGLYAPCMALVYALGMSPRVAFPIMMGSCAFLMPAAGMRFVKEGAHDRKASMGLTIGGAAGVFVAYYIVKSLPLTLLSWLVTAVVIYTGIVMLRSALVSSKAKADEVASAE